jgi:hypothetical protein
VISPNRRVGSFISLPTIILVDKEEPVGRNSEAYCAITVFEGAVFNHELRQSVLVKKGSAKRDGVCNPVAYVLCRIQTVRTGLQTPSGFVLSSSKPNV